MLFLPLVLGLLIACSTNSLRIPNHGVLIRRFRATDAAAVALLFHETVRGVNLGDYSLAQVQAWAPDDYLQVRDWANVCQNRFTVVAETGDEEATIAGFAELEESGHIDCFYSHKDYQRQGIGRQLYEAIEKQAESEGHPHLLVEASITAKPFFERLGFSTLSKQTVSCRGQSFINYKMEKQLGNLGKRRR